MKCDISILCADDVVFAKEAFSTLGKTTIVKEGKLDPAILRDVDALVIRSTTPVKDNLLAEASNLKFVGTATIGTDHMALDSMKKRGIHACAAPGCNARSVGEYMTAALLVIADRKKIALEGKTIGIIGHGHVGTQVERKAKALGMNVLLNDPPKERAGGKGYVSLEELLSKSEFVSLHTPLEKGGPDATYHLADSVFFSKMKPGAVFIDAARGPIVNTPDLLDVLKSKKLGGCVLDTWEGEPEFSNELMKLVDLGTPHIAGHSYEGKVMGTQMVYDQLCQFLKVDPEWNCKSHSNSDTKPLIFPSSNPNEQSALNDCIKQMYSIESDDAGLRAVMNLPAPEQAAGFKMLRKNYPVRREFDFHQVKMDDANRSICKKLRELGVSVVE